jgi:hypothetical protein
MPRPYRVPFGTAGAVALSIPPVALCFISMALSNDATRYVSLGGILVGLIVYRWQTATRSATEIEPTGTM